jgi:hypothetical protein
MTQQTEKTAQMKKAVTLQKQLMKAWDAGDQTRFDKIAATSGLKVLKEAKALISLCEGLNSEEVFCPPMEETKQARGAIAAGFTHS